ncbi:MAG: hypothetical protein OEL76_18425 [Siculibacillus sp.]|nr:hypothetical protein [Siculibacillus sp.]
MLAEVLAWLLTPATLDARRTGHLAAAVSLWSRARRCRADWSQHEARCGAVVERAIAGLPARRTCLVLGSGLMRDVSLPRLAATFEKVILVDIVHLWPIRLAARRFPNVRLVDLDVTGTADLLLGRATGIADPLARFRADPTIDLVISANCLSQLALTPVALARRHGGLAHIRFPDLGRRIVEGHLEALRRFSARVCLLSDDEGLDVGRNGEILDRYDLLEGVRLPPADDDWDWTLAPLGEAAADHAVVHRAHGFADFHAADARFRPPSG